MTNPQNLNLFAKIPDQMFDSQDWESNPSRDGNPVSSSNSVLGSPRRHLRAYGSLSYLEFIMVLARMWEDGHPDIQIRAHGTDEQNPAYPAIIYSLELRQPISSEPKPKVREEYAHGLGTDPDNALQIKAQRFQNIIKFQVTTIAEPAGAQQAEMIVEEFENFMMEFTPVFKELGVSEMFYARRLSDMEENRMGLGIINRSLTYNVYLEKVVVTPVWKLKQVFIDARRALENPAHFLSVTPTHPATPPFVTIVDQFAATPAFEADFSIPSDYSGHVIQPDRDSDYDSND